ncbi:MAG: alpha/beta fold hydrolase [Chloroflexi bacterium]|nr:alpha/beta fold hydrolase [Chloroflexota bacterium]
MPAVRQTRIGFSSKGADLEGILSLPSEMGGLLPAVVACPPDPQLGGTMESTVISSVCLGLNGSGVAVLRFNFRGVGGSTGSHTLGAGELEDARSAYRVLREWPGVDKKRIGLLGYSFGAGIAVRVGKREKEVAAVAAISPPLKMPPVGLQIAKGLAPYPHPLLLIIGARDGLTSPKELEEWAKGLGSTVRTETVPEADRAWHGQEEALAARVVAFFLAAFR